MSKMYGVVADLRTGKVEHAPIREILDPDDPGYWLKLARHIGGLQCDYKLKFYSLPGESPGLQRTHIHLRYLVYTMYLRLTERMIMVLRVLYERDEITLAQLRKVIKLMVTTDQEMGRRVGRLTRTRLVGQPNVPGEPTRDGFIPRDTFDTMGRAVGIHSVSNSCSVPIIFTKSAPFRFLISLGPSAPLRFFSFSSITNASRNLS
jgi:hypothetical protein